MANFVDPIFSDASATIEPSPAKFRADEAARFSRQHAEGEDALECNSAEGCNAMASEFAAEALSQEEVADGGGDRDKEEIASVEDEMQLQRQATRGRGRGGGSRAKGVAKRARRECDESGDENEEQATDGATKKYQRLPGKSAQLSEYKAELARALTTLAQQERRDCRTKLARASRRLGRCKRGLVSSSGRCRDSEVQWEGGEDSEQIDELRKRVAALKQSIEQLGDRLKNVRKTRQVPDDKTIQDIEEEIWEQTELRASKIAVLQREEIELKYREQRLKVDRFEHLRQLRSIEAEDQVGFSVFPPLRQRYQMLRLLRHKRNTDVYYGYDLMLLQKCAIRLHRVGSESEVPNRQILLEQIGKECEAVKMLSPHMSKAALLDHFVVDGGSSYVTVWEFCRGDPLDVYMERNKPLNEKDARGIILQILFIMRAGEARGRRLRSQDVKPSHFMVSGGEVRLSSITIGALDGTGIERTQSSRVLGEPDSPQEGEDVPLGTASDVAIVRQVGQILHEMLFMRAPSKQSLDGVQLPEAPKLSPECRDYLQRLLDRDRRLTPLEAWLDPFMYKGKR